MTKKRIKPSRVPELLEAVATTLEPLHPPVAYAVGGAVAMAAHGAARHTQDVDVFTTEHDVRRILGAFRKRGLRVATVMEPMHYAVHLPDEDDINVRIDVLVPYGEPDLSAVEYPERATVQIGDGEHSFNVFSANLLVATKFYSDRDKDEADIRTMLHAGIFEPDEVERLIGSIDQDGARDFRAMCARLSVARKPRKRPEPK